VIGKEATMAKTELSNVEITVYALHRLRGYGRKVHTEEVAYEAYQLAKDRFGWRLPQFRAKGFPDKDVVRVALTDAVKGKYGALVEGRAGAEATGKETDGWMLTPAGSTWVRENSTRIERALGASKSEVSKTAADRFRRQIAAQPLFQKFLETGDLLGESPYALTDMLNTSPDAPREVIQTKFSRLRSTAESVGDSHIGKFLDVCVRIFPDLIGAPKS
jgi:hypothetical protein